MKRVTKIAGIVVGIGAAVAAVAWMVRDRVARTEPRAEPPTPGFRVAPATPAPPADGDDLRAIRGIGPVFTARLAAAGISRFDQVAATTAERLASLAGVSAARAAEWIDQAASLV